VDSLIAAQHYYHGAGLAAAQIGAFVRVAVAEHEDVREVLINPEIVSMNGVGTLFEGCLSLPGCSKSGAKIHNGGKVARCTEVTYVTSTLDGKRVEKKVVGYMARIVQHEIDHMDGIFVLERMSPLYRSLVLRNFETLKSKLSKGVGTI
jgi:peptide deformylase